MTKMMILQGAATATEATAAVTIVAAAAHRQAANFLIVRQIKTFVPTCKGFFMPFARYFLRVDLSLL